MSFHDSQWRNLQAGEYVLGTLSDADLHDFEYELKHDHHLRKLVVAWQEKLQPLAESIEPVRPPQRVWLKLRDELNFGFETSRNEIAQKHRREKTEQRDRKLRAWQWTSSLGLAASALLAFGLWQSVKTPKLPQFDAISIVSSEDAQALWVVDVSLADEKIRVTAINPPAIDASQDHQLWLVKPNDGGVQSLGLLPKLRNQSTVLDTSVLQGDAVALAVSLESAGGSERPVPTGPVLYQGAFNLLQR